MVIGSENVVLSLNERTKCIEKVEKKRVREKRKKKYLFFKTLPRKKFDFFLFFFFFLQSRNKRIHSISISNFCRENERVERERKKIRGKNKWQSFWERSEKNSGEVLKTSSRIFVTILTYNPFLPLCLFFFLFFSFSFSPSLSFSFFILKISKFYFCLTPKHFFLKSMKIFFSNYKLNYSINIFSLILSRSFVFYFFLFHPLFRLKKNEERMKKREKKEKRRNGNKTWIFLNSSFSGRRES